MTIAGHELKIKIIFWVMVRVMVSKAEQSVVFMVTWSVSP